MMMMPTPQTAASGSTPKKPRRPRAIQACNFCRSKKYKCDGSLPCAPCRKHGAECVFRSLDAPNAGVIYSSSYVKNLERRLEAAETLIAKSLPRKAEDLPYRAAKDAGDATSLSPSGSPSVHGTALEPAQKATGTTASVTPAETVATHDQDLREDLTDDGETEVVDVNPLTRAIEFHGNTSSFAFLGRVRQEYSDRGDDDASVQHRQSTAGESPSLVSTIHNHSFLPSRGLVMDWNDGSEERLFSPQLYVFVDTYFSNLHYIHPILDQASFLRRCEDLWSGHPELQPRSFIALYFAVLSLGAIIRTWTEEKLMDMGRFEWSRMLFDRADLVLGKPGELNDLEAIQTMFIMAKVCQNELNPNLSYIYLGMAIRAALSIGMNRNTLIQGSRQSNDTESSTCKTWWGLYSLEIELSFALGRPDTLGMEDYHNRPKPPIDNSETSILTSMLGLSRIMRATSVGIYLSRATVAEKLARAFQIEADMNTWVEKLPACIRPNLTPDTQGNESLRDPNWARMQRLVLRIRYYNVKMLLLRPFLLHASKMTSQGRPLPPRIDEAITKCTDAAISTIETIYETCRIHTYFRTWWYNTTYLTFAASILLFRAARRLPPDSSVQGSSANSHSTPFLPYIDKTLDILDAMEESVVARKTAEVMRQMLSRLAERGGASYFSNHREGSLGKQQHGTWNSLEGESNPTVSFRPEMHNHDNFGFPLWDLGGDVGMGQEWDFPGIGTEMFWTN